MSAPLYTPEILRLAASLPPPAELEQIDGEAAERSPTCGSTIRIAVQLDSDERVAAVSQEVQACAFGQASAAILAAGALGRTEAEVAEALRMLGKWLAGTGDDPGGWPGLYALGPARARKSRHGAILLPFRALLAAMRRS